MITVTETVPVPAGTVTVKLVGVTPVTPVPGVEPKTTVGVPVKLEPLTVTELPPAWGPLFGLTEVTVGAAL